MEQKYESVLGKKSTIDILEQLRKEIEGDKPLIDNSTHTNWTVEVVNCNTANEKNRLLSPQ